MDKTVRPWVGVTVTVVLVCLSTVVRTGVGDFGNGGLTYSRIYGHRDEGGTTVVVVTFVCVLVVIGTGWGTTLVVLTRVPPVIRGTGGHGGDVTTTVTLTFMSVVVWTGTDTGSRPYSYTSLRCRDKGDQMGWGRLHTRGTV